MDEPKGSETQYKTAFAVARAGYPFIISAGFATVVLAMAGLGFLAFLGLLVTFFICHFFRDPDRITPDDKNAVVSPADGRVIAVMPVDEDPFSERSCIKISIFMSVFNVHVNRIPHEGKIKKIRYYPGKFFNASLDKASKKNERNSILMETDTGKQICFVQVAGLIARRIICHLQAGDVVLRGRRFGLICFGSRLDVYLPEDTRVDVRVDNTVKAGTSILGYLT